MTKVSKWRRGQGDGLWNRGSGLVEGSNLAIGEEIVPVLSSLYCRAKPTTLLDMFHRGLNMWMG